MSTATVMPPYRLALDPTFAQVGVLARNAGIGPQREAEESYGITGDGFTPDQGWSLPALRRTWNQVKDEFPKVDATLMNLWGWTAADPTSFKKLR